jgi:hypothetical protein
MEGEFKPFFCPKCPGKHFADKSGLKRHLLGGHYLQYRNRQLVRLRGEELDRALEALRRRQVSSKKRRSRASSAGTSLPAGEIPPAERDIVEEPPKRRRISSTVVREEETLSPAKSSSSRGEAKKQQTGELGKVKTGSVSRLSSVVVSLKRETGGQWKAAPRTPSSSLGRDPNEDLPPPLEDIPARTSLSTPGIDHPEGSGEGTGQVAGQMPTEAASLPRGKRRRVVHVKFPDEDRDSSICTGGPVLVGRPVASSAVESPRPGSQGGISEASRVLPSLKMRDAMISTDSIERVEVKVGPDHFPHQEWSYYGQTDQRLFEVFPDGTTATTGVPRLANSRLEQIMSVHPRASRDDFLASMFESEHDPENPERRPVDWASIALEVEYYMQGYDTAFCQVRRDFERRLRSSWDGPIDITDPRACQLLVQDIWDRIQRAASRSITPLGVSRAFPGGRLTYASVSAVGPTLEQLEVARSIARGRGRRPSGSRGSSTRKPWRY